MKYFVQDGVEFNLCEIKEEDMDAILRNPKLKNWRGHPAYYDCKARVWPKSSIKIKDR